MEHRDPLERTWRKRRGALRGAYRRVVVFAACRSVADVGARALRVMAGRRDRGLVRVTRRGALVQDDGKTRERQDQRRRRRHPCCPNHTTRV